MSAQHTKRRKDKCLYLVRSDDINRLKSDALRHGRDASRDGLRLAEFKSIDGVEIQPYRPDEHEWEDLIFEMSFWKCHF